MYICTMLVSVVLVSLVFIQYSIKFNAGFASHFLSKTAAVKTVKDLK